MLENGKVNAQRRRYSLSISVRIVWLVDTIVDGVHNRNQDIQCPYGLPARFIPHPFRDIGVGTDRDPYPSSHVT
jgi:hypothetical protein